MKPTARALIAAALLFAVIATPLLTGAQVREDILNRLQPVENVYGSSGEVDEDFLPEVVARIIQIALSVLGLIFLALIVWAGYVWMTAAGNEDQIKKSKQTMVAAVIGLVIVISAYIITIFVVEQTLMVTGVEPYFN